MRARSPSVYRFGDYDFISILIGVARENGGAAYIGEGRNRWPGVHRLYASRLYRLVLEQAATESA